MRHNAGSGLQFRLPHFSALALYPKRANLGAAFAIQGAGKIDDGAARIPGAFPVVARTLRIGGEESKVYMRKLLRPHALDEVDLVAPGFELANRFVVIEQANIHRGKVAFVQHLRDFLPLERARAYDGGAIKP